MNETTEGHRPQLLDALRRFVAAVRRIAGVRQVALLGSIVTIKLNPKDIDVLVIVADDADLTPLATCARRLQGQVQSFNRGADVFLADERGTYIGRTCHWRDCRPGVRQSCDALHCGRRPYLHDDLDAITLNSTLVRFPPVTLWPKVERRGELPADVEEVVAAFEREVFLTRETAQPTGIAVEVHMREVRNNYRAELPDGSGGEAECPDAVRDRLFGRSSRRLRRKHRWPPSGGLLALLFMGLCVCPVLGQSSERSAEASPLRTAVAREGARLAAEMVAVRPAAFEGALAAPQTTEDLRNWERLRGVKVGTRLVVSRLASPDLKVRMDAVAADTLQVRAAHGDVMSLRRDEVLAVYQDHRYTTKQWVGIGVLTGAATGLVIGVIADSQCGDCELKGLGTLIGPVAGAIYGPLGGLFVAGIANRNPPRLIYRAPLPTESTASSVGTEPTAR